LSPKLNERLNAKEPQGSFFPIEGAGPVALQGSFATPQEKEIGRVC